MSGLISVHRCLISVSDKTGIVEFARELRDFGIELISTGGTARALRAAGIAVREVSEVTNMPEMMGGRLKTLHPAILGALLARREKDREDMERHGIQPIDLVVVHCYPFEETARKEGVREEELIENIDIGGPTMVRAAAKNGESVAGVVDPKEYARVAGELRERGGISRPFRKELMVKAFQYTAYYDATIARYFSSAGVFPAFYTIGFSKADELRYGENPHQRGALYNDPLSRETSIVDAEVLQGKKISYNNIMDADAALRCVREFEKPAAVIVKHANPCGVAVADDITTAFRHAYESDRLSAFGGIVALNRACTKEIASDLSRVFVEVVVAPEIDADAREMFAAKSTVRVLKLGAFRSSNSALDLRQVIGGVLIGDRGSSAVLEAELNVVTQERLTDGQYQDLLFAWTVCRFVKSNAIVLAKDGMTVGVGAGQMSRVESVRIALSKAGERARLAVLASDAFFPFRDSIDAIAKEGIAAIIQPGGSLKDKEVIGACNEHGIAMVFTGKRAFLH